MGGGGFFQVTDEKPAQESKDDVLAFNVAPGNLDQSQPLSVQDIIDAIVTMVEPESWEQNGGTAVIKPLGGMLLVRQTKDAHKQIQELLQVASQSQLKPATIEAHWLLLDSEQLERLLGGSGDEAVDKTRATGAIDRKTLATLSLEVPSYHGRIMCFSEQTVHLVSGTRRTVVTGAIPIVGPYAVGYSLVMAVPNVGLLLQVTPILAGGEAVLDLESSYTNWGEQGAAIQVQSNIAPPNDVPSSDLPSDVRGIAEIDRVNMPASELATTVRVPLGTPVLVGGMSLVEETAGAEATKQLYLVIEVSAADK